MRDFKAVATSRRPDGSWLVRYFDTPDFDLDLPLKVTTHSWRWTARLAAWIYMNRKNS